MSMHLIEIIEEHESILHTGVVNIVDQKTRGNLAKLIFQNGDLADVNFKSNKGLDALVELFYYEKNDLFEMDFIAEPEIINTSDRIPYNSSQLKSVLPSLVLAYEKNKKNTPAPDLILDVNPDIFNNNQQLNRSEFIVLSAVSKKSVVYKIYEYLDRPQTWVNEQLISLRKKSALLVKGHAQL